MDLHKKRLMLRLRHKKIMQLLLGRASLMHPASSHAMPQWRRMALTLARCLSRLRPSRVDDLVDKVDKTIGGLDVALVAGAGGRGHRSAEGVVNKVLAEHAAVGDLGALERGEVSAGEAVRVDNTLDDMVHADILRERAVDGGILRAGF